MKAPTLMTRPFSWLLAIALAGLILWVPLPPAAYAAEPDAAATLATGHQVFDLHCSGCHLNGGNIVRRGKNLKQKALEKNGVDTLEAIAQLVTQGKGNMSAYGDRLTSAQIEAVSAFVLEQAAHDWR